MFKLTIACILLILFMSTCTIVVAVEEHGTTVTIEHEPLRSRFPSIPQCDKELWLRIKDGCH